MAKKTDNKPKPAPTPKPGKGAKAKAKPVASAVSKKAAPKSKKAAA